MQPQQVNINLRFNNGIFKCILCESYYNLVDTTPYAVPVVAGVIPQQNGATINMQPQIICEHCWEANKGDKGLKLKEPSPIVAATPDALNNLRDGIKN